MCISLYHDQNVQEFPAVHTTRSKSLVQSHVHLREGPGGFLLQAELRCWGAQPLQVRIGLCLELVRRHPAPKPGPGLRR